MAASTTEKERAMRERRQVERAMRHCLGFLALWISFSTVHCDTAAQERQAPGVQERQAPEAQEHQAPGDFLFKDEGELRAERITWKGGTCEFRALNLTTPVGSASCQQGKLQLSSNDSSGAAQLGGSAAKLGEISLTSSQIPNLQLPSYLKCLEWSLKAPSASIKFDASHRLSQLQLAPVLKAAFAADSKAAFAAADSGPGHLSAPQESFWAQLAAKDLLMNRDWTTRASQCQLSVEFLEHQSALKSGGYVCAVEQIDVDVPARRVCLSPSVTLQGPGIFCRQESSLEAHLIPPLHKQSSTARAPLQPTSKLLLLGKGATDLSLEGFSNISKAELFAPGGFCLDAARQSLQLLQSARPLTFSGQIDRHLLKLKGNRANITWNQAGKATYQGIIEQNVEFTLANRQPNGNFAVHHKVLAESLAFDTAARALTFASTFPQLVRYTSFDNNIALTAPTLRICMPAKGDVQLSGKGVVQARFHLDPKLLSPLKSPSWR